MTGERKRGTPGAAAEEQEWLTVPQVARLYGVHQRTLRDMIEKGRVVAERPPGARRWRISRKWLDAQHAQSGGIFPAADGRGLQGFYGSIAEMDRDEFWTRWRQEWKRVMHEELPLLMLELAALPARAAAVREGELPKRRKTG